MTIRFCDDRGAQGFSWIVDEPMTRTSHALAGEGRVWLVDPVRFEPVLARARELGEATAVLQLLDRHNRDCEALARELGVPHVVAPDAFPGTPFEAIPLKRTKRWRETALWWPAQRTLAVAEALGTNPFFAAGGDAAGVHLLLRLSPPRDALRAFEPEHLLARARRGPPRTGGDRGAPPGARPLPQRASAGRASRARARRRRRTPPAVAAPRPVGTVTSRSTERSTTCGLPDGAATARQIARAAGRRSFAGRRRPASRTGGLTGSASGGAPNERRTCSSGGVP